MCLIVVNIVVLAVAVAAWTVALWLSWGNVRTLDRITEEEIDGRS